MLMVLIGLCAVHVFQWGENYKTKHDDERSMGNEAIFRQMNYLSPRFVVLSKILKTECSFFSWLKSLKNGETSVKTEWSELRNGDIAKFGSHGDCLYMVNITKHFNE